MPRNLLNLIIDLKKYFNNFFLMLRNINFAKTARLKHRKDIIVLDKIDISIYI
jgi:hypothetical protein